LDELAIAFHLFHLKGDTTRQAVWHHAEASTACVYALKSMMLHILMMMLVLDLLVLLLVMKMLSLHV